MDYFADPILSLPKINSNNVEMGLISPTSRQPLVVLNSAPKAKRYCSIKMVVPLNFVPISRQ